MRMSVIDGSDRDLLFRVQDVAVLPRLGDTMKWNGTDFLVSAVEFGYEPVDEFRPIGELQRIDVVVVAKVDSAA